MQSKQRNVIKYIAILILIVLCWLEQFNSYIMAFLDQALVQASLVYASARSVNGIISLLQSAEVGIGIASIAPAQLLDPVNDLAEYIADAMRMSLGSLFIQRILFSISSGVFFSSLFTASAIGYLLCDYFGYFKQLTSKLLASLVLVRFLIPLVVLTTGLASQAFLDEEINFQNQYVENTVDTLSAKANTTSALSAQLSAKINSQKQSSLDELELIAVQQQQLKAIITDNKQQLDELDKQIEAIQTTRSLTEKLTLTELPQAKPLLKKQRDLRQQQASLNNQLAALHLQKNQQLQLLHDYNDQLTGNSGNLISKVVDTVSTGIAEMADSLEGLFIEFLNLVSLLIIKLFLIPLLFLYLFCKAFKAIWQRSVLQALAQLKSQITTTITDK
ncbi:hypothetical protein RC083_15730 [Pseudoalteromonas haloplanktis]|uniref:Uncharacterized protein n=1 Tax=Pseudoalteromonas haloplanktis TaxID=228 RepID=A0ABU1BGZ8_PSEHA|nr:hypothetical protein [Pseudoalteromonas haloplanktis]MDQ9093031.1 hypothetical protein [Pseudoalteromonas haloplanktis]